MPKNIKIIRRSAGVYGFCNTFGANLALCHIIQDKAYMDNETNMIEGLLAELGYHKLQMTPLESIMVIAAIGVVATILFYVCKLAVIPLIRNITNRTKFTWDDHLFNERVTTSICHIIPPTIFYWLLPFAFKQKTATYEILMTLIAVYLVAMFAKLVVAFISSLQIISEEHDNLKNKPLKGVYQMMKIVVVCASVIVAVGIIFDKDPASVLAGLGASAAVLMLVFKDTILGLVAGVQLSANDMLRPGDWIKMEKHGVDGIVFEVSLTTVKVRNWDMTVVTLPPYLLVSDSFQNWRGMWESKGRRIARPLLIDTNSIRFCTEAELDEYLRRGWLTPERRAAEGGRVVNLAVYRDYIMQYLTANPTVSNDKLMMVRHQEMSGGGLPLQVYCFSVETGLRQYEEVQADVLEHLMAMLPAFGLKMFQRPSGEDVRHATCGIPTQAEDEVCNRVS